MTTQRTDILKHYLRYLKLERNVTGNTLDAYERDVLKLMQFLDAEGLDPCYVGLPELQQFAASLHDLGVGARSQCRILSGVRSFFRFLELDGYRDDDPTELLESPQTGDHLPEVLTTEEVDRLEAAIDLSEPLGQRNKAIIEVLFSCGLRVSELVGLRLENIYADEHFLRIYGKFYVKDIRRFNDALKLEGAEQVHDVEELQHYLQKASVPAHTPLPCLKSPGLMVCRSNHIYQSSVTALQLHQRLLHISQAQAWLFPVGKELLFPMVLILQTCVLNCFHRNQASVSFH